MDRNPAQDITDTVVECVLMARLHMQRSEIMSTPIDDIERYVDYILVTDKIAEDMQTAKMSAMKVK